MVDARVDADDRTAAMNRAADLDAKETRADIREAYDRGRKDERASRRRHPIFMTFLFVAAICGVVLVALAAVNGSFTRAGGVVDQNLNMAVTKAEPQVRDAAAQAGQSLRNAGQSVRQKTAANPG